MLPIFHRFRHQFEHQVKHLSVFISMLFPLSLLFFIAFEHFFSPISDLAWLKATNDLRTQTDVLSVIIGTMTTIVITVFSITMVAIQLTSQQFSPRILRLFLLNDNKIQRFLGIFIGAIGYSLLLKILPFFLPNAPLSMATFFIIAISVYAIVWFLPRLIMHVADNVNVASITQRIKNNTIIEIEALYQDFWKMGDALTYKRDHLDKSKEQIVLRSPFESGYLDDVDYKKLSEIFTQFQKKHSDLPPFRLFQMPLVGEFIMKDTTELLVIEIEQINDNQKSTLYQFLQKTAPSVFNIQKYRSYTNDITYGIRQLVDIAIKAISPAVNDPTTCLNCLDYLGDIIRQLAVRRFPSSETQSLKGKSIFVNEITFEEAMDLAFDQIFHWGKGDPVVLKRLIQTIRHILPVVENPYHLALLIQQVDDMAIRSHLTQNNVCTKESHDSIMLEISKFEKKVQQHCLTLEQKGILGYYAKNNSPKESTNSETRSAEIHAIQFLQSKIAHTEGSI
ncbi:MAG: DUF2254 domain-containing protein [Saprospiraceae bacterium]|nr:DUF2254 domain-containing protein [Saprospiraceae bacterium]